MAEESYDDYDSLSQKTTIQVNSGLHSSKVKIPLTVLLGIAKFFFLVWQIYKKMK
jgi:hypothetical protein